MISNEMLQLGTKRSVIREIFEYGKIRAGEIGAENVYDFSLGNPNVPAPECVKEALLELLNSNDSNVLHSYTSAQGDAGVRKTIADSINERFGTNVTANHIYMTVGAAASLCICAKALTMPGDEFITFAPFFPEYRVFVESVGAKLKVVPVNTDNFQIDFKSFKALLSPNTKAIIMNSPNNPSGVVYSEETVKELCSILEEKSKEYNHPIYLISDEPYREIVYDNIKVPYLMNYYKNTLVCYSYSKSLSLPGERIGYIAVSDQMEDGGNMYAAICGAGRALGYVCAPSLFQFVIQKCIGATSDINAYKENRDILYNGLTKFGYDCVRPDGAFYLFVKALEEDANAFCEKAKKYELLLVPGDDFGCPGYVRVSYCVKQSQIVNSLPAFEKLIQEYQA
ncbi:pyridoxal phosphate-dependent aminotransferase [Cellulosilyticum sp. ST5]|uniref:Aminotransferase n=1 Tax=Cellulosilyticum lentocellum (strain ATCC 49066 / DSM 5427 / NCIMB 11756 / RHM5) TaxID=642492 RepID=F2JRU0_CELLD|nr:MULTISPECIES: pyridoxal phosphate-dependent aminotransferase [Cellulosilyticum]ADZ85120.1 Aspartate transaminase [Cellulosilyticum lentocellum DSM 5427]QEH70668.1 pyridoxal phosphate-dependent aminotransferase [Cellulosilyticum sp. WCF-2]